MRRIAVCFLFVLSRCGEDPVAMVTASSALAAPVTEFNACWDGIEGPRFLSSGQRTEWIVTIRNCSNVVWPDPQMGDVQQLNGSHAVRLVHRWRDANGPLVPQWSSRSDLPWPLLPGRSIELPMSVAAPARGGHYTIEFDLIQENVVWFGEQGGSRPSVAVEVR